MSGSYGAGSPQSLPPLPPPKSVAHPPVPPRPPQTQSPPTQQHFSYVQHPPPQPLPQYQDQYRQPPPPPLPQVPQQISSPPPPQYQHQQQYQQPHQVQEDWLPPGLKDHTLSDLQTLLANSTVLSALSQQHPAYAANQERLQAALRQNLQIARAVAQLEQQLTAMRDQTAQMMLQHTSLQTQWRRKQSEMDDALSAWGPRAMYQRLVASIGEQESILNAVFESFLEGGGHDTLDYTAATVSGSGDGKASDKEVTDWVKRIREGATVLEKRREMRARWDEGRVGGWR